MVFRGLCKVVAIAFVTNQILTTIFTYFVQQLDSAPPHQAVWLFSCVTCGMVTLWLQADARRVRLTLPLPASDYRGARAHDAFWTRPRG